MKNNTDSLKAKVLKARQNSDIALLYSLESQAHESFDEDTLSGFYANILDIALERLTDTLEAHRVMDMNDVDDFATLRALYEYAIENYSAGAVNDAAALFEVLSGLSNDKNFSKALKLHTKVSKKGISLDDFIDNIADIDATQNSGTFYISCFKKEAQKMLEDLQDRVE